MSSRAREMIVPLVSALMSAVLRFWAPHYMNNIEVLKQVQRKTVRADEGSGADLLRSG